MGAPSFDIATKAQVLALKQEGFKNDDIHRRTKISHRQINTIASTAKERGWRPEDKGQIVDEYVARREGSGRPKKLTEEKIQEIVSATQTDRFGVEKTTHQIAAEVAVSQKSVWRALKRSGLRKTKPTMKPGLTAEMKAARLAWCLKYQHWTLEDWKNVIWTDETSVVLGVRRGGRRVWRKAGESCARRCVRPRWKGASEFMFWGSFSYYKKGPCHIWKAETKKERDIANVQLKAINDLIEPQKKAEWELVTAMARTGLRNKPGKKPQWKFTKKNGAVVREGKKGGIDWWRYQQVILKPLLIPFAQKCQKERPQTIVQEDGAPAHASPYQRPLFDAAKVPRLKWMGNSPDLNAIEPCWKYIKWETTRKGPLENAKLAKTRWLRAWKELPQRQIQRWIKRIPWHIQQIIRLNGGNEYIEGCKQPVDRIIKRRMPIVAS